MLEVIPDDLFLLGDARTCDALEPAREPLVQARSLGLGDRIVSGVADQQVPEPVRVLAGQERPLGPHELLANERSQLDVG